MSTGYIVATRFVTWLKELFLLMARDSWKCEMQKSPLPHRSFIPAEAIHKENSHTFCDHGSPFHLVLLTFHHAIPPHIISTVIERYVHFSLFSDSKPIFFYCFELFCKEKK